MAHKQKCNAIISSCGMNTSGQRSKYLSASTATSTSTLALAATIFRESTLSSIKVPIADSEINLLTVSS